MLQWFGIVVIPATPRISGHGLFRLFGFSGSGSW